MANPGSLLRGAWQRLPPSMRDEAREALARWRERADRARFWSWRSSALSAPDGAAWRYLGRASRQHLAAGILGATAARAGSTVLSSGRPHGLLVDARLPAALWTPGLLRSTADLRRPVDEILAGWEKRLRRAVRQLEGRLEYEEVRDPDTLEAIHQRMLVPYAEERHQDAAVQLSLEEVRRIASFGRLDLIRLDGEPVAARLGMPSTRRGVRRWHARRFGCIERVFEQPRLLGDLNTASLFAAMRRAQREGYQVFDCGLTVARPDGGGLQFKRRRGCALALEACHVFFSVRLPPREAPALLAASPLFSVERGGLVLNLGVPADVKDEDLLARCAALAYPGLRAMRLHAARAIPTALASAVREALEGCCSALEVVRPPR